MSLEGSQINRFRLLRLLKRGGMGEVYLAEDDHLKRQVAIKVLQDENPNAEATRLFQREARAIAMLDHPHILPLFDFGEASIHGTALTYMVMPFCKEDTLATWMQQRRNSRSQISPSEIASIIQQAASALQFAHNRQIVHQDVKPSNLLIRSSEDPSGPPDLLLADFGVAKSASATATLSQSVRGTPTYMAPEQWEGTPVPATDQYALAVLAYELLTGHPPFQGGMGQVMYQHMHAVPQPPSTLNPDIPADVDTVILHALAKTPEERFGSVTAFARALEQALHTNPSDPDKIDNYISTLDSSRVSSPATPPDSSRVSSPALLDSGKGNNYQEPRRHDIHAQVMISETEAREGTHRLLTLPGGQQVPVTIPAGINSGQILHLDKQIKPTNDHDVPGALILTITIAPLEKQLLQSNSHDAETIIDHNAATDMNGKSQMAPSLHATITGKDVTRKRRGPSRGATILLVILALLVVAGSGIGFFIVTRGNGNQNSPPYPPFQTLTLNDPLSNNSQNHNWDNTSGVCTFTGGAYHVSAPSDSPRGCPSSRPDFSNFAYQAQMTIVKGDGGGIFFRYDSASGSGYYFDIYQDGKYIAGIFSDCNNTCSFNDVRTGSSPAIKTGLNQTNLVAVVANGSTLDGYVNNIKIVSVSDSTYSHGPIGLAAVSRTGSQTGPTEVAFSNAKVWI